MRTADSFWDMAAAKYVKSPIKNVPAYEKTMERTRAHLTRADKALEIGCGSGSTAMLLADRVDHITASDISAKMVGYGKANARDSQVGNIDFLHGTVFDDTFERDSFDVVMAFNLIHLMEGQDQVVARIYDLLKPGGRFISKTPCLSGRWTWRVAIRGLQLFGRAPYVAFLDPPRLEALITGAGFSIMETGDYPPNVPSRFVVAKKP